MTNATIESEVRRSVPDMETTETTKTTTARVRFGPYEATRSLPAPNLARCTNDGPHDPHRWFGKQCPGATPLGALTLPQVVAIARALGVSPGRILPRLAEAMQTEATR